MTDKRTADAAATEGHPLQPFNPCNFALPCQQFGDVSFNNLLELTNTGRSGRGIKVTASADFGGVVAFCGGRSGSVLGAVTGYSLNFDGVFGLSVYSSGVEGQSTVGNGVLGTATGYNGVAGHSGAGFASGVYGENFTANPNPNYFGGYGVAGRAGTAANTVGVYGEQTGSGWAGFFYGKHYVVGKAQMASSGIQIDHPLEPHSKFLNHSSVQSPDMKNVYDGVVTLDSQGSSWVELPAWFEALNRDFRYQLTPIGSYAPVYVAQEIANNRFHIAGGKSGQRISWLVTGIRCDVWAAKNPITVEEDKDPADQGKFLYPLEAGHPKEMGISYSRTRGLETFAEQRERIEQEEKSQSSGNQ